MYSHRILLVCVIMLLLMGCGSVTMPISQTMPQITLTDTAPSRLDIVVGIQEGGYDAATMMTTHVAVGFVYQGYQVNFRQGETITCQNMVTERLTTGFDHTYATSDIAGKFFTCTYISGRQFAMINFMIPPAPSILEPMAGTIVTRSSTTLIHFQGGDNNVGIVALGAHDKASAHVMSSGMASVDTNQFATGAGSIALTQYPPVISTSAPAFAAMKVICTAMVAIAVTWV